MTKDIKIGISRNRLFDFQNCVSFVGEYKEEFEYKELSKAIKMLAVKEPLIVSRVGLDENRDAYLQLEKIEPEVEFIDGDVNAFLKTQRKDGLDFFKNLFKFFVLNKKTLVILSHTVVSDAKSLLILAEELMSYYNKESVSVEPKEIKLFSDDEDLPIEIHSFVAERVTEVLENNWIMKPEHYNIDDYKNAKSLFFNKTGDTEISEICIDDELCEKLFLRCEELKVDFSSCVAFAFMKALSENTKFSKKLHKVNMQLDRRPYFVDSKSYSVGAFNGTVTVDLPENKRTLEEQAKVFHESYYKKFAVCFNAFYNEFFLSRLSPDFLDSTFMYKAGKCKNKYTKKLAKLYGCEQQFLMGFASYNLKQRSWEKLSTFHHISVKEPHKSNENVSLSLVMGEKNILYVEYHPTKLSGDNLNAILSRFISVLNQI